MATVEDIMNLDFFKHNHLELVAGEQGLYRIVTRPNIAQLMNFSDWMGGCEFLLINGVGLGLDQKENMLQVIENANKANAACIAFEISQTFIPKIPQEAIDLANQYQLPIFTLSWDVPFGPILNTVYDFIVREERKESTIMDIMRNILFANVNPGQILQQTDYYGYDLRSPHQCMVFQKEGGYEALKKHFREDKRILYLEQNEHLIVFYPYCEKKQLKNQLRSLLATEDVYIGIGDVCTNLMKYQNSYYQALRALRYLMVTKEKQILFYDELGLLTLLDDVDNDHNIKQYIMDFLAPLQEYQTHHSIDLIETLNVYQECNFNVAKASQKLFIHRNTLLQRLEKIAMLLDVDLNNFNARREIMNVMNLKKYYG